LNFFGADDKQGRLPETDELGAGKIETNSSAAIDPVFSGGGEMGALMRALDWSQTSLGTVSKWPQSLKAALRIILASRFAMFVWWDGSL
jgi:hypothetical protein